MQSSIRKGIALIAASLVNHRMYDLIQSHGDHRATRFTGRVGPDTNVYDYDRSDNITGTIQDGQYALYDFKSGTRVSLRLNGRTFSGRDAQSGQDFNGSVEQHHVTLFDFETHQRHEFTLRSDGRS